MSKVLILKGLPASGKSTFAKKLVGGDIKAMGNGWKRVNKDDLRAMLDNSHWSKGNEKFVILLRNHIILEALASDYNVVVDDTNLNPAHEKDIRNLVEKHGHTVETKFFDVDLATCIERDLKRPVSVGETVIRRMYKQYLQTVTITPVGVVPNVYTPPEGKPEAIIVDIDGTLAHKIPEDKGGRNIYDLTRVHEDELDEVVAHMVKSYADDHKYKIIICSGREDVSRNVTEEWLAAKGIQYDGFFMRKAGDRRKDSIVKRELFDTYIRDNYNIKFVLDDRNQVVDMWRNDLGLKVLQVAEGDF